jgi:hypothetical protein
VEKQDHLADVQDKDGVDCDERHAEATEYTLLKQGIG